MGVELNRTFQKRESGKSMQLSPLLTLQFQHDFIYDIEVAEEIKFITFFV